MASAFYKTPKSRSPHQGHGKIKFFCGFFLDSSNIQNFNHPGVFHLRDDGAISPQEFQRDRIRNEGQDLERQVDSRERVGSKINDAQITLAKDLAYLVAPGDASWQSRSAHRILPFGGAKFF